MDKHPLLARLLRMVEREGFKMTEDEVRELLEAVRAKVLKSVLDRVASELDRASD